jgi:hypothetical protein
MVAPHYRDKKVVGVFIAFFARLLADLHHHPTSLSLSSLSPIISVERTLSVAMVFMILF